jgi:transcriptional regulator with XRE-family HTH domain
MDPMHGKPIIAAQLRAGRAILGLSQAERAQRAGLPIEAIAQAEADREPGASKAALERQGVIFLDANGGDGSGVPLRRLVQPDEGLRPDQLTSENDI